MDTLRPVVSRGFRCAVAASVVAVVLLAGSSIARAAVGGDFELVLEKVGAARDQAASALGDVLEVDDDEATDLLDSLPAVLRTGIAKSEADMLRKQLLEAMGKDKSKITLKVRPAKANDPQGKAKPLGKGKGLVGNGASVRRGNPPSPAKIAAELERSDHWALDVDGRYVRVEPRGLLAQSNNDHLWLASGLPDLDEIRLYDGSKVTDIGLSYLPRLKNLKTLTIGHDAPGITDRGLKHLAECEQLRDLILESPNITDNGLKHLAEYEPLRELWLKSPKITDDGLTHLAERQRLRRLTLLCPKISSQGLQNLNIAKMLDMRDLRLSGSKVGDEGLALLKGLHELRALDVEDCPVTDAGLKHVPATSLERLNIARTRVTIASIDHLATLPQLYDISLGGPAVTDEWLKRLPPSIQNLTLVDSKVTNTGLQHLKSLKSLSMLTVKGNKGITPAGTGAIKQAFPKLLVTDY